MTGLAMREALVHARKRASAATARAAPSSARTSAPSSAARTANGINQRIDEVARGDAPRPCGLGKAELDFVPDPWTPAHAFAVGKLLAFGLSNTLDFDLIATVIGRLAPQFLEQMAIHLPAYDTFAAVDAPAGSPPAPKPYPGAGGSILPLDPAAFPAKYEPFAPPFASNNWAVAADRSADGRPLLAGDPHQGLTSPIRFWPLHMSSVAHGGTLDVIGFAFVGTPSVELGHNARVGWRRSSATCGARPPTRSSRTSPSRRRRSRPTRRSPRTKAETT